MLSKNINTVRKVEIVTQWLPLTFNELLIYNIIISESMLVICILKTTNLNCDVVSIILFFVKSD